MDNGRPSLRSGGAKVESVEYPDVLWFIAGFRVQSLDMEMVPHYDVPGRPSSSICFKKQKSFSYLHHSLPRNYGFHKRWGSWDLWDL